jgi:hypothetical protein
MPLELIKKGVGFVVKNKESGKEYSKKPIPKTRAEAQMRLLTAITKGNQPTGNRGKK